MIARGRSKFGLVAGSETKKWRKSISPPAHLPCAFDLFDVNELLNLRRWSVLFELEINNLLKVKGCPVLFEAARNYVFLLISDC